MQGKTGEENNVKNPSSQSGKFTRLTNTKLLNSSQNSLISENKKPSHSNEKTELVEQIPETDE